MYKGSSSDVDCWLLLRAQGTTDPESQARVLGRTAFRLAQFSSTSMHGVFYMPGMELRTGDENDSLIQSFDKRFLSSHSVSGTV